MAASNPGGEQQFWADGLPWQGVAKSTPNDEGAQLFWADGLPAQYIYPAAVGGAANASWRNLLGVGL